MEDKSTQHLVVKIYDDEGLQAAELIGCAQFQLKDLEPGKVKSVWLKLVKDLEIQRDTKERGQVRSTQICLFYWGRMNPSLLFGISFDGHIHPQPK